MRDFLKFVGILLLGLLVAIFIYPFLHEAGHSVVAVILGASIVDFQLFPLPYVVCEVSNFNPYGSMLIGLGGMYFPMAISQILNL